MGLKVVGILLEGEKYEPATKLFQRLACTPIELQRRKIEAEGGEEGIERGRGLLRLFAPPFRCAL